MKIVFLLMMSSKKCMAVGGGGVVGRGGVRMSNLRDEYIGESCAALLLALLVGIACFYVCGRGIIQFCAE